MFKNVFRFIPIIVFTIIIFSFKINQTQESEESNPIDVLHYTLNLDIVDLTSEQIKGTADLQIQSEIEGLEKFYLNLASLHVDSVWIEDEKVKEFSQRDQKLWITLFEPINKGSTTLITIFYHGTPAKDPAWGGFYFKDGFAYNMGVGMKSDPHPFGRAWYPCIDNFTDRATYTYFVTVNDKNTAVCPGTLVEIVTNPDSTKTFHWELHQTIPTYLSTVAVSDYICISDTLEGIEKQIPSMVFVSPKDSLNAVACFRDMGKWLNCFEDLFGPYRWEKIGYMSVPFSGGAMEHATAISFSERTMADTNGFKGILVHEFAHNWFGNLVTCSTADDMWINEGWASYLVALYKEYFLKEESFQDAVMANHTGVLRFTHIRDGGYRPVFGNSPDHTYGSTVYNKGFDVAHVLRGYIGDDRFFEALDELFSKYAYSDISSKEFLNFMAERTETNLNSFSKYWVYSPGFPHYSIDSFLVEKSGEEFATTVFIQQKLLGTDRFHEYEKMDIVFYNELWEKFESELLVSDSFTVETFEVPFNPSMVILDPNFMMLDATSREAKVISGKGQHSFKHAYITLDTKRIKDSSLIHVSKSWIEPDTAGISGSGLILDHTGYWTINALGHNNLAGVVSFEYENFRYYGNEFIQNAIKNKELNSVILAYRKGPGDKWKKIPFEASHSSTSGKFTISKIKPGDYCLALIK